MLPLKRNGVIEYCGLKNDNNKLNSNVYGQLSMTDDEPLNLNFV